MSADPFNLDELRRSTPKYLGLDSIRDALPALEVDSNHRPWPAPEPVTSQGDVSMQDQSISENEEGESRASSSHDDTPEVDMEDQGISSDIEKPKEQQEQDPVWPGSLQNVLSPTQIGARMAVLDGNHSTSDLAHQPSSGGVGYVVHMPMPSPWHENMAYMVSTYTQIAFNVGIAGLLGFLFYVVNRDVAAKVSERRIEMAHETEWCTSLYLRNKCWPGEMRPELSDDCYRWSLCMENNPSHVRWLSMYASLTAEMVNELIEPLSARTMTVVIGLTIVSGLILFTVNYFFGFVRARAFYAKHDTSTNDPARTIVAKNSKDDIWR